MRGSSAVREKALGSPLFGRARLIRRYISYLRRMRLSKAARKIVKIISPLKTMEKIELHPDFKDFLRPLNSRGVNCLMVGGYAVGYHGYPRATDTNSLDTNSPRA